MTTARMIDAMFDMLLVFVLLAAVYVPLERSFRARTQGHLRVGLGLDLAYFAVQSLLMVSVFVALHDWMGLLLRGPAVVTESVERLPWVGQAVLVVVLGDLALYWAHRLSHSVPLLWRLHGVHHTAEHLDWVAAYREHPLDGIYSQLFLMTPCMFLGVSPYTIMPFLVFRGLWAVLVHSNTRLPLGRLGILLGDPVLHRWHHARRPRADNFANLAPYLDILFGTHHRPDHEDYPLGLDDSSIPAGFLPQLLPGLHPVTRWLRVARVRPRRQLMPLPETELAPLANGSCFEPLHAQAGAAPTRSRTAEVHAPAEHPHRSSNDR